MHKTHIFDQKNNAKFFLMTYLPYFFRTVTGPLKNIDAASCCQGLGRMMAICKNLTSWEH